MFVESPLTDIWTPGLATAALKFLTSISKFNLHTSIEVLEIENNFDIALAN
jgi:hypothetical protein